MTCFIFAYHSDIEEDVHPGPSTVDDVASPQPHEDYEHHEVAMVVVTNAVKHPGFGGTKVKEYTYATLSIHTYIYSVVAQKLSRKIFLRNCHI